MDTQSGKIGFDDVYRSRQKVQVNSQEKLVDAKHKRTGNGRPNTKM